MDRELIQNKIQAYADKLLKKTDYEIKISLVSKTRPEMEDIKIFMIEAFYCSEIMEENREKSVAFYRQLFAIFASMLGYNDTQVSTYLGKHRTFIIYARRCILNYLDIKDPMTVESFNLLYNKLTQTYGKDIFRANSFERYYPQ
jgi:hypothetical protein